MTQEALKQLWRAKTRAEATMAIDSIESGLNGNWWRIGPIEFESLMGIIRAKSKRLNK